MSGTPNPGHPHDSGHGHGHHHGHAHDPFHSHGPDPDAAPLQFSDPAQESLNQALRSGFGVLRWIMVVLLVAYFASGWFQVGPGQQGLIVRFGRLLNNTAEGSEHRGSPIFGPGWHFALPDPFDTKITIRGTTSTLRVESFVFQRDPSSMGKPLVEVLTGREKLNPGVDGYLISGDRNLSHGLFSVEYRIYDAARFVQAVGETNEAAEPLLRRLVESAVVRTVAGKRVEEILKIGGDAVAGEIIGEEVKRRVTEDLLALETGIEITKITAETVEPGAVQQAFRNVGAAENESEKLRNEARQQAVQILTETAGGNHRELLNAIDEYGAAQTVGKDEQALAPLRARIDEHLEKAEGEVRAMLSQARTAAIAQREQLATEFRNFESYREQYRNSPMLTVARLWVRMRENVFQATGNEVFSVPKGGEIEILTNRDPARIMQREAERWRQTPPQ